MTTENQQVGGGFAAQSIADMNQAAPAVQDVGDISSLFASNEKQLMNIKDPDSGSPLKGFEGQPMGLWLDDKNCEACQRVTTNFRRKHAKAKTVPAEGEMLEYSIDLLAAAIVGFQNIVKDGQLLPYSPAAARELLQLSPVIRSQVDLFLGSDTNFLKGT